jgi:hypothetical protein
MMTISNTAKRIIAAALITPAILLVVSSTYVSVSRKALRESSSATMRGLLGERIAPIKRVEKMWRDKAECANKADKAEWYSLRADAARSRANALKD